MKTYILPGFFLSHSFHVTRTVAIFFAATINCFSQSAFINLGFESGNPVPAPVGELNAVTTESALPGWRAAFGGSESSWVLYNAQTLDASGVSLIGPDYPNKATYQGDHYLFLRAGPNFQGQGFYTASVMQQGLIPPTTRSLFMIGDGGAHVYLNNNEIGMFLWDNSQGYQVLAADITSYSGLNAELKIQVLSGGAGVDLIAFSPIVVPEPSAFLLFLIGTAALGWQCRKMRQSKAGGGPAFSKPRI